MTPERWRHVKDLLASALDRGADDREAFLKEACAEDPSLRREVESLLASDEAAALLERPAFTLDVTDVPTLRPGIRLGPYEVVAFLGAGGMGEVYRAQDARFGREVAVKVLPRAFSQDRERLKRFEREARAVSALNHPNVVTIFDVGSTGDLHYAVSELLEGETLRARLAAGPLAVRDALGLARDVVAGLVAAHERGIVHRDLKPENVFVTRDERLKILDFGLAKQMEPAPSDATTAVLRTHPGMVLGTVGYMSPEQVRGLPADHRSDIFSFGVVLHEMLTGRRAFSGDSQADALSAILRDQPPPASESNPEVPPELDALGQRCLRKRPEERFQTARELGEALEAVLRVLERPAAPAAMDRSLASDPAAARLSSAETLASMGALHASPVAPPAVRRLQRAFQLVRLLAPAFAVVVAWIALMAPDGAVPVGLVLGAVWGLSMFALWAQARQLRRAGFTADDVAAAFAMDARQLDDEATSGRLLALIHRPLVTSAAGVLGMSSLVVALELRKMGLGLPLWRVALASFGTLLLAVAVPVALGSPRRSLTWSRLWAGAFGRGWLALAGVGLPRQEMPPTPTARPPH
jgi:serine/threonine protein kinase